MRNAGAAILSAILAWCSRDDLPARCAAAFAELGRKNDIEASAAGARVKLAGAELELDARIENEGQQDSQWIVGIAVTVSSSSVHGSLGAGSVGVGTSRADALDTAIREWVELTGLAILRAVALKERSSGRFVQDGYVVYAGATGIRGPVRPAWSHEDHARLLAVVAPLLRDLPAERLHSLSLTVVVYPVGEVQGDVRLDGAPSPLLLEAIKEFSWPRLKDPYIFKQHYVTEGVR
jgi:hypothetical protein